MRKLVIILLLSLPVTVLSQSSTVKYRSAKSEFVRPVDSKPIVVQGGNVINASYKIVIDSTESGSSIDLVIYTYSYREALRPFDSEALFMVDGLSKVFKIKNWTSRCASKQLISSITIRLDKEEFQSIGYAGTVGLKIGMNIFELPYQVRHSIRRAVTRMETSPVQKMIFYNPGSKEKVVSRVAKDSLHISERAKESGLRAEINE